MELNQLFKINKNIITKTKSISFKRCAYEKIKSNIDNRRSSIITGLRQIGKTTLLKQILVEHEEKAIFITIDSFPDLQELEELISLLVIDYQKEIIIIDEIQNVPNWGQWIIDIYNKYSATYLLSGSGSISTIDTTGSARFTDINLLPLSLKEYISFTNDKSKSLELLNNYAGIKAITAYTKDNINVDQVKKEYFETYLYQDLLKYESKLDLKQINILIYHLTSNTSGEILIKDLANGSRLSKTALYNFINKHIKILEKYNIIKILKRTNLQNSSSKAYKIYMNPHLYLIMNNSSFYELPDEKKGYFIESLVLFYGNLVNPVYIKQDNNKKYAKNEIDFVDQNKWIEVKATTKKENLKKQINKLFKEYNNKNILEKIIITLTKIQLKEPYRTIDIISLLLAEEKI